MNFRLFSIEKLERWATAPVPKELHYFAREDFQAICKYAVDIMRENEKLRAELNLLRPYSMQQDNLGKHTENQSKYTLLNQAEITDSAIDALASNFVELSTKKPQNP